MRMIQSLQLQNYKPFENTQIPISPITILLGANSVGKSSIIQMLMLLHQTAEERAGFYSSAFKIYGNYVNVGDYKNLFRDKVASRPLGITIEVDSLEIGEKLKDCKRDFVNIFRRSLSSIFISDSDVNEKRNINDRADFHSYITEFVDKLKKYSNNDNHLLSFFQFRLGMNLNLTDDASVDEIMRSYDIRDKISQMSSPHYKISFQFLESENRLKISKVTICIGNDNILFEIENKTNMNKKVNSCLPVLFVDTDYLSRMVNFNNTIFELFSEDLEESEAAPTLVASFLFGILKDILSDLKYNLQGEMINYCSPLRAHPKRYYMLDKAKMTISLDTLDGDAIAEVMKDNVQVKERVNEWFKRFGFNIDVKEFKEVIHHMNVHQNGLDLDITDVGFGISQVLPIIIQGFLSVEDSITIIEQPEIHLHPKMQADLGDLFIDIVNTEEKKLIIETHSEYLLRRIRRRISEGRIKSSDVAICLFHPKDNETQAPAWVEVLKVEEKGNFKWPEEFYCGDLYDDIIEFVKNQADGNDNSSPLDDKGSN